MKIQCIYAIRNIVNGKRYIGSTIDLDTRKPTHFAHLRKGTHHSQILQLAFVKYGESSFVFDILEIVDDVNLLFDREQHYLNTLEPEYNICKFAGPISRRGLKSSPEHCAKMSAALTGRKSPMEGKHFSEEHKQNLSKSHKGKPRRSGWHHTAKSIAIMKEKRRLNPSRPKSETARRNLSEGLQKRWSLLSAEQKSIIGQHISESKRTPDREVVCIVCHRTFHCRPNGKKTLKTCSSSCLSERRRQLLTERNKRN